MFATRLVAVAAFSASAALLAKEAPPAPAPPEITVTGEKEAKTEELICKRNDTGSLLGKRVCMTRDEWAKSESNAEATMETMRDWQRVRCNMGSTC